MRKTNNPSIILSEIKTPNQALYRINSLTHSQLKDNTKYSDVEMLECISDITKYTLTVRCNG